ncbi:unnamed protein product [Heligmosomoides polygyrus]|uniref:EIF-2B GDP-GTP exchange factor subunit epsilon n=1 Tax=Heligmosomoides polygyrus TaxID=6339 RepID=A0A183G7W3_HELPZ|nr:unnamed protein product [Heligmosomoides polygyrus]
MPPKREQKKDNDSLTGVIVVDSYDPRFAPLLQGKPWCLYPICNVPLINHTLSWIARTEVKKLLLVVSEKNLQSIEDVESERRANKDNVMTLIYSDLNTPRNAVIGVEKQSKKLTIYHRQEDPTQLDIDKPQFLADAVIRRDVVDSGIAICSLNISAQFSDNFDFQHRDDVIREILVNEEILHQNIHVEVLPSSEAALCVTDYDSLLLISNLLMERWFHPLVLDRMVFDQGWRYSALSGNVYVAVGEQDSGRLAPLRGAPKHAHNSAIGQGCDIDDTATISCSSIGRGAKIGRNARIFNCFVGENCVIGANCHIEEAVLGSGTRIPDGVHLQKQSVISAEVAYPADLEVAPIAAVCSSAPHEDYEEVIKCEPVKDWKIVSRTGCLNFYES